MLLTNFLNRFRFFFLLPFLFSKLPAQNQAPADSLFTSFMKRWNITGGSIAISRQGQFVYQQGLGYANKDRTEPTAVGTRFRIASLSKSLTAAAIMKLVQEHKLALDQKVFGKNALLNDDFYCEVIHNPFIYDITVRHLSEHTAGWDRQAGDGTVGAGDPPFIPLVVTKTEHLPNPVSDSALIRYSLRRGPDHQPGSTFAYSNVGYLMLGKIIEKVSGRRYAAYLQEEIFAPLGLLNFELGHTKAESRLEGESYYFSDEKGMSCYGDKQKVPLPYGAYNVDAMNAHGGWIAAAGELCQYLNNLAGFDNKPALLHQPILNEMLKPGYTQANYAKGWFVNNRGTFWHTGSLDGTATFMGTTKNGYCWAFLFNGRGDNSPQFWKELDALPWKYNQLLSPAPQETNL